MILFVIYYLDFAFKIGPISKIFNNAFQTIGLYFFFFFKQGYRYIYRERVTTYHFYERPANCYWNLVSTF